MAFVYESMSEEDKRRYNLIEVYKRYRPKDTELRYLHEWVVDRETGNYLMSIHGSIGKEFPDYLEWLLAWNGRFNEIWLLGRAVNMDEEREDNKYDRKSDTLYRIFGPAESLRALRWWERNRMFHILKQALTAEGKRFRNCRSVLFDSTFHPAYWGVLHPLFRRLRKK